MISTLLFDLDDTLYRERDFVFSGYKAVAQHLASNYDCPEDEVLGEMMHCFESHGRRQVFPRVRERFLNPSVPLDQMISVYRAHVPKIRLCPGYGALLRNLRQRYRMGIITDGLPEVQRRKVSALGLESLMDRIVYTWEHGAEKEKPHPAPFAMMMDCLKIAASHALFIGDNPEKDCAGAHGVGMKCVRILSGAGNGKEIHSDNDYGADFVIDSLLRLPEILRDSN